MRNRTRAFQLCVFVFGGIFSISEVLKKVIKFQKVSKVQIVSLPEIPAGILVFSFLFFVFNFSKKKQKSQKLQLFY